MSKCNFSAGVSTNLTCYGGHRNALDCKSQGIQGQETQKYSSSGMDKSNRNQRLVAALRTRLAMAVASLCAPARSLPSGCGCSCPCPVHAHSLSPAWLRLLLLLLHRALLEKQGMSSCPVGNFFQSNREGRWAHSVLATCG
jgi:hypothetical protein